MGVLIRFTSQPSVTLTTTAGEIDEWSGLYGIVP